MKIETPAWRGLLLILLCLGALPSFAAPVLFVVGNTTLGSGDDRVKQLLESKGHVLTIKSGAAAVAADATGKSLVVISSTVISADVNTKFRTVAVPVLVWESHILDDMGMTNGASGADYGTANPVTQVQINLPSHQMAAGYNGGVAVYDAQSTAAWGKPGASAQKVAVHTTDPNKAHIFVYEGGAAMFGLSAPARRVGFFLDDVSPSVLSGNGVTLFHAAANWAMGVSQPAITAQPVSLSVSPGQSASFSVTATGGALNYQWRKNGAPVGTNSNAYTLVSAASGDNGALISVVVSNTAGTVTSANAVLTVGNTQPVVSTHPKGRAVEESQKVVFTVEAAGTPPLSYKWRRDGVEIPGATSASYEIPEASLADHGAGYSCLVTNAAGSTASQAATLVVVASPFHAQTQYYEALNSTTPSFKLGWRNDAADQSVNLSKDGVDQLRLKNDYVHIPGKLNFGPGARIGFRWELDPATGKDFLALGTGDEATPVFDVLRVRRTGSGLDGVDFPMGFYFPLKETVDGSLTTVINGLGDEAGMTFYRHGIGPTTTSEEDGSLGANQARFSNTLTSTEIAHEYSLATEATLDAGQLRFHYLRTAPNDPAEEATTVVNAYSVSTGTVVATNLVTTPKWRVASTLPDYVLKPGYALMPLEEVEAFTRKNHRLPHFQSAEEMAEKGIDVADMNIRLLKTVEELTLHLVALKKDLATQQVEVETLKGQLKTRKAGKAGGK